jgi:N-acetyl-gamma-glutamylphosphate reductase
MSGASWQRVQPCNIRMGYAETCGLEFPGLHPI